MKKSVYLLSALFFPPIITYFPVTIYYKSIMKEVEVQGHIIYPDVFIVRFLGWGVPALAAIIGCFFLMFFFERKTWVKALVYVLVMFFVLINFEVFLMAGILTR